MDLIVLLDHDWVWFPVLLKFMSTGRRIGGLVAYRYLDKVPDKGVPRLWGLGGAVFAFALVMAWNHGSVGALHALGALTVATEVPFWCARVNVYRLYRRLKGHVQSPADWLAARRGEGFGFLLLLGASALSAWAPVRAVAAALGVAAAATLASVAAGPVVLRARAAVLARAAGEAAHPRRLVRRLGQVGLVAGLAAGDAVFVVRHAFPALVGPSAGACCGAVVALLVSRRVRRAVVAMARAAPEPHLAARHARLLLVLVAAGAFIGAVVAEWPPAPAGVGAIGGAVCVALTAERRLWRSAGDGGAGARSELPRPPRVRASARARYRLVALSGGAGHVLLTLAVRPSAGGVLTWRLVAVVLVSALVGSVSRRLGSSGREQAARRSLVAQGACIAGLGAWVAMQAHPQFRVVVMLATTGLLAGVGLVAVQETRPIRALRLVLQDLSIHPPDGDEARVATRRLIAVTTALGVLAGCAFHRHASAAWLLYAPVIVAGVSGAAIVLCPRPRVLAHAVLGRRVAAVEIRAAARLTFAVAALAATVTGIAVAVTAHRGVDLAAGAFAVQVGLGLLSGVCWARVRRARLGVKQRPRAGPPNNARTRP